MSVNRIKPYGQIPYDESLNPSTRAYLDWVASALNTLIGQQAPTGQGIPALTPQPTIDPSTSSLISKGSRAASITTAIAANALANSIQFFWDGTTNGGIVSVPFQIYRDDGTITPAIYGNQTVSGLAGATNYFFYPYWDESLGQIRWATNSAAVGSPAYAFPVSNILALQQQYMRGHIPLANGFSTTGVTTGGGGSSGGGGGGGGGGGCPILGTLLHQLSGPIEWRPEPWDTWIHLKLHNGLTLTATPNHQVYATCGKMALAELKIGDKLVTYKGEGVVERVDRMTQQSAKMSVEVPLGHLYWANGILSHNKKPL